MRRLAYCLFIIVILAGCSNGKTDNSREIPENTIAPNTVSFSSGVFFDKNWDDPTGTYCEKAIPNQETAIKVATAIWDGMEKTENEKYFILQDVFYDVEDGIWIVSFWEDDPIDTDDGPLVMLGSSCSIAIDEDDGRVLRIWFGE